MFAPKNDSYCWCYENRHTCDRNRWWAAFVQFVIGYALFRTRIIGTPFDLAFFPKGMFTTPEIALPPHNDYRTLEEYRDHTRQRSQVLQSCKTCARKCGTCLWQWNGFSAFAAC